MEYIHIKDILLSQEKNTDTSYCNKVISGLFFFQDATHAICNAQNKGSLLICPECKDKIINILNEDL